MINKEFRAVHLEFTETLNRYSRITGHNVTPGKVLYLKMTERAERDEKYKAVLYMWLIRKFPTGQSSTIVLRDLCQTVTNLNYFENLDYSNAVDTLDSANYR